MPSEFLLSMPKILPARVRCVPRVDSFSVCGFVTWCVDSAWANLTVKPHRKMPDRVVRLELRVIEVNRASLDFQGSKRIARNGYRRGWTIPPPG